MTQAINIAAAALQDASNKRHAASLLIRRANRIGMRITKSEARHIVNLAVRNK